MDTNQGMMAMKDQIIPRRTSLNLVQAICALRCICAAQSSINCSIEADLKSLT